jgi:glycosyltransferase involved in cell wall biosynthesis
MSHSAVLLEVAQALSIPVTATFTDFFGFCANNKLETVDGELCAGPSASRVNCLSCQVKALSTQAGSPVWVRKSWSPRRARTAAVAARLACALPLLRHDPTIAGMRDVMRRPEDLVARYNAHYRMAVAPTQFLRSAYEANGITVPLHNLSFGIDVDRTAKPHRPAGHVPVIGFVGQMARHKGPDLLLQAFRGLKTGQARLRLWGDLDQDRHYADQLRSLAEGREVEFMGTFGKDQVAEVMRGIDVLVIPSRWYENSPLVLLGALATHTPVVVSDVAGMTEFLEDSVNGMRFARGDAIDLERVLRTLLNEPGRLAQMSCATHYPRTARDMALETLCLIEAAMPRCASPSTATVAIDDETMQTRKASRDAIALPE